MAKTSGLGHNLYVAQFDLSGDVGSVTTLRGSRAALDVTGINALAMERTLGLKDGEIVFNSWWNTAAGTAHPALSTLLTTNRIATYAALSATPAVGDAAASIYGRQVNYDPQRGADGSLMATTQILGDGSPLEWGVMLTTGKQTFTGAANTTASDYGTASTAFGAAAYLHAFSFSGTSATLTIQDSADNSTFAAITGLAFTAVSGATSERIATAVGATIRRYVRIAVTGTFTSLVCAVSFIRYETAQTS